ncbi:Hypp3403 [Branchiostoma lanceolatum]|uniref:Hypp3403 protein n=1 Tax=Branchiostoma lanceolatum TaxID=7740 RepID=A0A8K0EXT0_BRALA|nr:Hypp3403 [Branchiostoma lanceolatum]
MKILLLVLFVSFGAAVYVKGTPHTTEGSLVSKLVTDIPTVRHSTFNVSHGLNLTTPSASSPTASFAETTTDRPASTTIQPPLQTSSSKTGSGVDGSNPGSGLGAVRQHRPLTLFGQLGAPLAAAPQTRDPSCPPVTGTEPPQLVTSDGFYKKVTEDRIEILATDVSLDETSPLFDPCKDFYLETVSLTIKGHLRWKGRNVYISAVNLTVAGDSAAVDVSYMAHGQPDWDTPAQSGTAQGQAGQGGQAGGVGQRAGNATLYVGFMFGGRLEVLARGGSGGLGQAGGDGHVGAPGQPNQDRDACCHGRSTAGTTGGKGGDGGKPGQSGDGGPGGVITIRMLNKTWEDLDTHHLQALQLPTTDVSGGPAGPPAAAGQPGPGGPGGGGSGTHCYNAGHRYDHHWRCEGPYAPPGPQGPSGNTPPPAPSGHPGPTGQASVDVIDFEDISEHISPEMVQMTFRQGNRYYKEGDVEAARNVYLWIYFTMRNSSRPELRGHAREAMIYLMQIQHGLDFWAHAQNNIPMNSYSSIYTYLSTDIVPYAIDVEKDYNLYFTEATSEEQKMVVAKSSMDHNKFTITVLEKQKLEKLDELTQIQSELRDLEQQQTVRLARAQDATAECQDAIEADLVHKATAIHFSDILKIAGAAIKIYTSIYTGGLTLKSGIDDIIGALEAGKKLKGLDFLDQLRGVKTIIKNIWGTWDKDKGIIKSDLKDIEEQYDKIKDTLDHEGQENQQKIVVDGKKFDEQFDKWLYLAQCRGAKPRIQAYLNVTQAVNDKLVHHDAVVIKIHSLDAEVQVLQQQNARLRSETAAVFDPTIISYAIAIGRVYVQLKDSIVDQMKRLQEAYNYQFLERRPFSYDDSRLAMIEAWLANNRISMLQRMEKIGNDVQVFNADTSPMTNTIVLRRRDLADDFAQFDNGTGLSFVISGAEDLLMPMTHVHMTDVKVWIPGVRTEDRRVKVWLKRYGTSLVYDQQGGMWTFTHAPRTMLFHYNTDSLQVYSKADIHQPSSDYVTLSPIGPWTLAVPREYNPGVEVTGVREIHLQLTLTFLPCAQPVCPPRSRQANFTDAGASSTAEFRVRDTAEDVGTGSAAWVAVLVVLAVLFCVLVVGIVYVRKRRSAHKSPPGQTETTPLTANTTV